MSTGASREKEARESNLVLGQIHDKVSSIGATTLNINCAQDAANKYLAENFQQLSCSLEAFDGDTRSIMSMQDSTVAIVGSLGAKTNSILVVLEKDAQEVKYVLDKIHVKVSGIETEIHSIAPAKDAVNMATTKNFEQLYIGLDSIEASTKTISSVQESTAAKVGNLVLLNSSLNEQVLSVVASREKEAHESNLVLGQIHDKVSSVEANTVNVASAQDAANKYMAENFRQLSCSLEAVEANTRNISSAQESTAAIVCSLEAKTDSILAVQENGAQEGSLVLSKLHDKVSSIETEAKDIISTQDTANMNITKNFEQLRNDLDSIGASTKIISSVQESTAVKVSNLERLNSSQNEEVLLAVWGATHESNLVLGQIHSKVSSIEPRADDISSAQDAAFKYMAENFQGLSCCLEAVEANTGGQSSMKIATGTQVSNSLERLNSYLDTLVSSATKNHASASMTDENQEESCYAYSIEADWLLNIDHHETPTVPIELKPHIDLTCICTEDVGNVSWGNNVMNEFVIKEAPVPSKELLAEADPSLRENVRISCQGKYGFGAVVCDEMSGNADEVMTEVNPTFRGSVTECRYFPREKKNGAPNNYIVQNAEETEFEIENLYDLTASNETLIDIQVA